MLAGAYYERTGDREFIEQIWPNVERALAWIDRYGDVDGDGFVEYARRTSRRACPAGLEGLAGLGVPRRRRRWPRRRSRCARCRATSTRPSRAARDAGPSAGRRPTRASALERAGRRAARALRGGLLVRRPAAPTRWRSTAASSPAACARRTPAIACSPASRSPSARAGSRESLLEPRHVLRAGAFARIAAGEARYNPMSYHNGSVWPHDNALIAAGLRALRLRRSVASRS